MGCQRGACAQHGLMVREVRGSDHEMSREWPLQQSCGVCGEHAELACYGRSYASREYITARPSRGRRTISHQAEESDCQKAEPRR